MCCQGAGNSPTLTSISAGCLTGEGLLEGVLEIEGVVDRARNTPKLSPSLTKSGLVRSLAITRLP